MFTRLFSFQNLSLAAVLAIALAPALRADDTPNATGLQTELAALAEQVGESVVGIEVSVAGGADQSGAGVVISADGLVLTSDAVVTSGAASVRVIFRGGETVSAHEVARDDASGAVLLALGAVDDAKIKPAQLGKSKDLALGQIVATFGNPFGTISRDGQPAMSLGVVSALYAMPNDKAGGMAIETDAAVNPGSFGGPLVDARGHVVGIVVPTYRNDRWLGLARPIDAVQGLVDAVAAGPVRFARATPDEQRGVLGIFIYKDDDNPGGARIERVAPDSPAGKAGLREGDIVKRFGEKKAIKSAKQLAGLLGEVKAAQKVTLRVERDGWSRDFELVAAAHPEAAAEKPYLGAYLTPGDGYLAVEDVVDGGPAAQAGLRKGDKVVRPATLEKLSALLKDKRPGQKVEMGIERDGWRRELAVTLGAKPGTTEPQTEKPTPEPPAERREKRPGFLGVYLAEAEGGIAIQDVLADGPAAKAGLQANDVVTSVAGEGFQGMPGFTAALQKFGAGDTVELGVRRGEATLKVGVTLGERPARVQPPAERTETPTPPATPDAPKKPGFLGISVAEEENGLTIIQVVEGSPAAKAALKLNQRILDVDGDKVATIADLAAKLRDRHAGDTIKVTVEENGAKTVVNVVLSPRD